LLFIPDDSIDVFNLQVLSGGRLSCDTVIGPLVQLLNDSSTSVQVCESYQMYNNIVLR